MASKVPILPDHLLFASKVIGLLPCLITNGGEGDEGRVGWEGGGVCPCEEGQQGRGEVYKWDPSFFMHRGDIPPSANFAPIAQSLASLISALGTFVKGLI